MQTTSSAGVLCLFSWKSPGATVIFYICIHEVPLQCLLAHVIPPPGVAISNGERWRQLRRFTLSTLRDFGMGRKGMEAWIQEEGKHLVARMNTTNGLVMPPNLYFCWRWSHKLRCYVAFALFAGAAFDPTFFLSCTVSNVICCLVFGQRFSYENEQFLSLLHITSEAIQFGSSAHGQVRSDNGPEMSPFKHLEEPQSEIWQIFTHRLRSLSQMYNVFPRLMGWLPGRHHEMFDKFEKVRRFTMEKIKEHQETLDPSSPRDYIDCFLIRLHQVRQRLQPNLDN